jgi:flagellar biogenesis protein FliO
LPPAEGDAAPKASGWSTLLSALGSLVVVLGLFLAVVWFLRRTGPKSMTVLPSEVFEVLGHSPLAARQQAQLVRCGGKLLLLSVTAAGAETLAEIAEPAEVERLVGLCQQARPNSATASFRNLLAQFAGEGRQEAATAPRRERTGLARFTRSRTEAADA